jgi:hypothetical protein
VRLAVASFALLVTLSSCTFAVKHPAATAAIVGGVIAAGTCEIGTDFEGEHATCGLITLGAAAALGGIVLLATVLGGEGNTILHGDDESGPAVPQDPTLDAPVKPEPTKPEPADPAPSVPAPVPTPPSVPAPVLTPPSVPAPSPPAPPPPSPSPPPPATP